ncbi:MAG TPA: hypothetical protein VF288_01740 [Mycobacteriales bacterium]
MHALHPYVASCLADERTRDLHRQATYVRLPRGGLAARHNGHADMIREMLVGTVGW